MVAWLLGVGVATQTPGSASSALMLGRLTTPPPAMEACSCSECHALVGRPASAEGADTVSLLTCRADDAGASRCGGDFCETECKAVVPSKENHTAECRPKDHPSTKGLSLAQMKVATALRTECIPPPPCTCSCFCPEIVYPVPPPLPPAYPTPQPFFSALQTPATPPPEFPALYQKAASTRRAGSLSMTGVSQTAQEHNHRMQTDSMELTRQHERRWWPQWPGSSNRPRGSLIAQRARALLMSGARQPPPQPFNLLPPPPVPPTPPPPPSVRLAFKCPEVAPCNCYCHCGTPRGEQFNWQKKHQAPVETFF